MVHTHVNSGGHCARVPAPCGRLALELEDLILFQWKYDDGVRARKALVGNNRLQGGQPSGGRALGKTGLWGAGPGNTIRPDFEGKPGALAPRSEKSCETVSQRHAQPY